jgi:hypothetical protein
MTAIGDIFNNPLVTFIVGLIPSIIAIVFESIKYYQSKARSGEQVLQPHFWKLHTITTKILDENSARNLPYKEKEWQEAIAKGKIIKDFDALGQLLSAFVVLSASCNSMERLFNDCVDFETEYQQMDTNGLLSLLSKRHASAFARIADFHGYTEGVVFLTKDFREKYSNKAEAETTIDEMDDNFTEYSKVFFSTCGVIEEIFNRAPEIERELKKLL